MVYRVYECMVVPGIVDASHRKDEICSQMLAATAQVDMGGKQATGAEASIGPHAAASVTKTH